MPNEPITDVTRPKQRVSVLAVIALIVAISGLFLPVSRERPSSAGSPEASALQGIMNTQTLRVGYEGYPPYTIKDPSTGKLSGLSVDLAEYLAREAGWKVVWVQTSPDTKIPDLQAGRFDVMTEPIFRTIPRATRVTFSRPYAYFGDAVGVVRKGEKRFRVVDDLNKPGITVVVRQGYTDQTFATDNLPAASIRSLKVDDVSQLFLEVITGKADVALSDLEQAKAFAEKHRSEVELRFTDPAPSYIPAGLMLKQGDFTFYNFLNTSLEYMEANSVLARLNKKYGLSPGLPAAK
ncbi:MAG: ABC transporter substrate-binding protein [Bryobacteraceae bacterium]